LRRFCSRGGVEFHHRVCTAWDTIGSVSIEWGNGDIDEPDVKLDEL
jgi:hypothetical protein